MALLLLNKTIITKLSQPCKAVIFKQTHFAAYSVQLHRLTYTIHNIYNTVKFSNTCNRFKLNDIQNLHFIANKIYDY